MHLTQTRDTAPLPQKLADVQSRVVVPLAQLKDINKRMNEGEASSREAKKEMIETNLRLVISSERPQAAIPDPFRIEAIHSAQ